MGALTQPLSMFLLYQITSSLPALHWSAQPLVPVVLLPPTKYLATKCSNLHPILARGEGKDWALLTARLTVVEYARNTPPLFAPHQWGPWLAESLTRRRLLPLNHHHRLQHCYPILLSYSLSLSLSLFVSLLVCTSCKLFTFNKYRFQQCVCVCVIVCVV